MGSRINHQRNLQKFIEARHKTISKALKYISEPWKYILVPLKYISVPLKKFYLVGLGISWNLPEDLCVWREGDLQN